MYEGKVKSFLSHKAHTATLISVSLALSQTPLQDYGYEASVSRGVWCACLLPSFHRYSLRLPTERWPG